jgi:RES domain-containing protein
MLLWRISLFDNLNGDGGLLVDGRWHQIGHRIVYTAEHPAAALLEMIVHSDRRFLPLSYQLLKILVPDNVKIFRVVDLHDGWKADTEDTKRLGVQWLTECSSSVMQVPSAIVPETWNFLINPVHPDAARIRIENAQNVQLDDRLR